MRFAFLVLLASLSLGMARSFPQKAPDFELPLLGEPSQTVRLSDIVSEHPTLLVFWATWCPTCVEEIPALNDWHARYSSRGLRILAVNVMETPEQIFRFQRTHSMNYPVLLDRDGRVSEAFELSGVPVTIMLEPGGKIVYYSLSLPKEVEPFLN